MKAGRPYSGPFESGGRIWFAHLLPIVSPRGAVIGAYGALYPNEALDTVAQSMTRSPLFRHGFLMVVDGNNRPLFPPRRPRPGLAGCGRWRR